ncbi:hypothetical protein B566_EDAN008512 [Ephemera danica]|nr:hypothetical protein B566_EDAN008512 [Ephemera danica]
MIEEHNKRFEDKQETYKMCLNEFADKLPNEFHPHEQPKAETKNRRQKRQAEFSRSYVRNHLNIPDNFDWRKRGAVTAVKHQGTCGSCWAHATVSTIHCSTSNSKCNGGSAWRAYVDINSTIGGLVPSDVYPYEGRNGTCRYNSTQSVVKVLGYRTIGQGDEAELKEAVATVGRNGTCRYNSTQSVVKVLGYRTIRQGDEAELKEAVATVDYWIIKNSHGKAWGEEGYMRLRRGANTCGIAFIANYPIILPTGPLSESGQTELQNSSPPTDPPSESGQTNLQSGTDSRDAAAGATESLRNTEFILLLLIMTLFSLALQ